MHAQGGTGFEVRLEAIKRTSGLLGCFACFGPLARSKVKTIEAVVYGDILQLVCKKTNESIHHVPLGDPATVVAYQEVRG